MSGSSSVIRKLSLDFESLQNLESSHSMLGAGGLVWVTERDPPLKTLTAPLPTSPPLPHPCHKCPWKAETRIQCDLRHCGAQEREA